MMSVVASPRSRSKGVLAAALVMALSWSACSSSPASDGESCESGPDCASGRCANGTCAGSECECEGAECRGRSSCSEGWLCTRGTSTADGPLSHCRQQCTGVGSCPSDKNCRNGVCRDGGEPFTLSWTNIPRSAPCRARVPCEYKVAASPGVTIETYTWSFLNAPAVETTEPSTTFAYPTSGSFSVVVRAKATTGTTAELRATDLLCSGGVGESCDVNNTICCEGTCVRGLCK